MPRYDKYSHHADLAANSLFLIKRFDPTSSRRRGCSEGFAGVHIFCRNSGWVLLNIDREKRHTDLDEDQLMPKSWRNGYSYLRQKVKGAFVGHSLSLGVGKMK